MQGLCVINLYTKIDQTGLEILSQGVKSVLGDYQESLKKGSKYCSRLFLKLGYHLKHNNGLC